MSSPLLPHSEKTEQHVLACCLMDDGVTLNRAKEAGISEQSFYLPETRTIWATLTRLPSPALELLIPELGDSGVVQAGGMPYLLGLSDGIGSTAHAGTMITRLRELEQKRHLIRQANDLISRTETTSIEELSAQLEAMKPETGGTDYESRRVRAVSPPAEPTTRLFLAGKPIATPGNLCTIISRAKTGKTAALGGAVAAIIAAHHDRQNLDTLGFTAPHTKEAVVVIDTEQSPYDAYTCYQRSLSRAGQDTDPDWLCHYAMVGLGCAELQRALPGILRNAQRRHNGIFTLILDGVADFVTSVNDEVACNAFITWLRALSVDFNCPIICVIHSNEGVKNGDDGRGWLGKELTRKAESNLLLKKTGAVTTITSEKQRKAPITEADGVAFEWSDEQQRHVSCARSERPKTGRPATYEFEQFITIFPKHEQPALTRAQLFRFATDMSPIKDTAFRDVLHKAVANGELVRIPDGQGFKYRLPKV